MTDGIASSIIASHQHINTTTQDYTDMIIPTVTTTECIAALADQGFNGEPITSTSTFKRIHENGRSVVIGATGEHLAFDDDCGIEHVMNQEAERFAHICRDSGIYSSVVVGFIDTQANNDIY